MNLPLDIEQAFEKAVVAILNATDCTEEEAEALIDAMADLIFTTMKRIIMGLHFGLYTAPLDMYKAGDRLDGVNGILSASFTQAT